MKSRDPKTRLQAVAALAASGKDSALEALLSALRDSDAPVREAAAQSLAQFGDESAVTPLTGLLADPNPDVRQAAAESLRRLGDPRAIKPLVPLLRDSSYKVRWRAATALDALGWRPGNDTEYALRAVALEKLELATSVGAAALDALVAMLKDKTFPSRHAVVEALGKIGDARVIKPLENAACDEDSLVRTAAVNALSESGDARAVDTLLRVLNDRDANVRAAAVDGLGRLGDVRAVEPISRFVKDSSWGVRIRVAEALGRLRDKRAANALVTGLKDDDHDVRQMAAEALGHVQETGAIGPLVLMLKDENSAVRQAAALALRRTDRHWEKSEAAQKALPELQAALTDKEYWVRQAAADALAKISDMRRAAPQSTSFADAIHHKRNLAMDALMATLRDSDPLLRQAAAEVLGRQGDPRAVESLVPALADDNEWVGRAAALSLDQLNWKADGCGADRARQLALLRKWDDVIALGADAVGPLVELLRRSDSARRHAAAVALGQIAVPAAVEPLLEALADKYRSVRRAAAGALRQIGWDPDSPASAAQVAIELGDWDTVNSCGAAAMSPLLRALEESSDDPELLRESIGALTRLLQSQAADWSDDQLAAILTLKDALGFQMNDAAEQDSTLNDPVAFDCRMLVQLAEQELAARKTTP